MPMGLPNMGPELGPVADPDPEVDPSEQLQPSPETLTRSYRVPGMTPERRKALGRRLQESYMALLDYLRPRLEYAEGWRADYEQVPLSEDGYPWPGASRLRAPNLALVVDQHAMRLNTMAAATPPFVVETRDPMVAPYTPAIEEVLADRLEQAKWESRAREMHRTLALNGNALMRVTWREVIRRVPIHETEWDDAHSKQLLVDGYDPLTAMLGGLDTDKDGRLRPKLNFKEQVEWCGVELKVIPQDRMVIFPANASCDDEVYGIGERLDLRGAEMLAGAKEGVYFKDAVKALLDSPALDPGAPHDVLQYILDEREDMIGLEGDYLDPYADDEADEKRHRLFQCVEMCLLDDLNGDGFLEWYWATFDVNHGILLRLHYSPYEHGRSHYVRFSYIPRDGTVWGMGVAERVALIQKSASDAWNTQHNLSKWLESVGTSFWYDVLAGDMNGLELGPGRPKAVMNLNGIKPMEFPMLPAAIQAQSAILDRCKTFSELLGAVSNVAMGKETDADKTLGEVRMVAQSAQAIFEDYARGVMLCQAEVADQVRWLTAQYANAKDVPYRATSAPMEVVADELGGQQGVHSIWDVAPDGTPIQIQVPGREAFGRIPASLLKSRVDLKPAGLSRVGDRQTRLQVATQLMGVLQQHPLTAANQTVQMEVLSRFLREVDEPNALRIMELIVQGLGQNNAALAAEQAAFGAQGPEVRDGEKPPDEGKPNGGGSRAANQRGKSMDMVVNITKGPKRSDAKKP